MKLVVASTLIAAMLPGSSWGEGSKPTAPDPTGAPLMFEPAEEPREPRPIDPERDDIICPNGQPLDLRPYSEQQRREIVEQQYPRDNPAVANENARRYVDYLYKQGRLPKPFWEEATLGRTCMYGPAPAPQGVTLKRMKQILAENAGLTPR